MLISREESFILETREIAKIYQNREMFVDTAKGKFKYVIEIEGNIVKYPDGFERDSSLTIEDENGKNSQE